MIGRLAMLAVCLALLVGCSEDEPPVDTTDYGALFVGKWQVTSGSEDLKYFLFQEDRIWYILGEDSLGFRGVGTGSYLADESVISFGSRVFLYVSATDQITLLSTVDTINLVRNAAAPEHTQWVRPATPTDSIASPVNQVCDIGTDSSSLWIGSGLSTTPLLFKINIASRRVDTITAAVLVNATEWDGANLWCSSPFSNQLSKLDPATGAVLSSSLPIATNIFGLAWDGQYLWAGSQSSLSLSVYDRQTNTVVQHHPSVYGDGMAFAGGYLYICKDGDIHKCLTSPFRAVTSYSISAGSAAGIAYDGSGFWVTAATGRGPQFVYKIYRVAL